MNIAGNQLSGRATITTDFEPVERIVGIRAKLVQVFYNILLNAAQAFEEGSTCADPQIRIAVSSGGDGVEIIIEDNGVGIEMSHLSEIFDPFFTTKSPGKGTGLGLSMSHEIIEAHGGTIEVESEPGQGTSVRIFLPSPPT